MVGTDAGTDAVPAEVVKVVDTTAAGDSFNAGFMASRFQGQDMKAACGVANRLASEVIQHRGAIIPVEAMPV